ncbi:MAG: hydrolase [Oscillospiraceae bacterium]|jgi:hypothetical protein|nr:hydrolase [Oscillospiraceae bacterium]
MVPEINGKLENRMIKVPEEIEQVCGIKIFGKLIRAVVFSTDIAIIRNVNADAVIAVYPFPAQPIITQAIMMAADIPIFMGVGGGTTKGQRAVNMAMQAEYQGARGVVLNAPIENDVLFEIHNIIDIPIIVTICVEDMNEVAKRLESHVSILNVSAAEKTPQIVAKIKLKFPHAAVVATGGPTKETILATIEAGADAISWTPPTTGQIFKNIMNGYRNM